MLSLDDWDVKSCTIFEYTTCLFDICKNIGNSFTTFVLRIEFPSNLKLELYKLIRCFLSISSCLKYLYDVPPFQKTLMIQKTSWRFLKKFLKIFCLKFVCLYNIHDFNNQLWAYVIGKFYLQSNYSNSKGC